MSVSNRTVVGCLLTLAATGPTGCAGGARRDRDEPRATFAVQVTKGTFPRQQTLARPTELAIVVRNAGARTVPDVAVTVDGFSVTGGADPRRPVWIVDRGPAGGETAHVNTWALGPLAPGARRTFRWKLTAVQAGSYVVSYRVSPGLDSRAQVADAAAASGRFRVTVAGGPVRSRVNPRTGAVVRGGADPRP